MTEAAHSKQTGKMPRESSLDLDDAAVGELFQGAARVAAAEVAATRSGPVFADPPSAARVTDVLGTDAELPTEGAPVEEVLALAEAALGLGRRASPGMFGYVLSPSVPISIAAELLAAAADQNITAWRSAPAAVAIERQTLRWLDAFVGFGGGGHGVLVSGGSAANLTAILIALRARGSAEVERSKHVVLCSEETHFSVTKAIAALGLMVQVIGTDDALRLDVSALKGAITDARERGLTPCCIVANAGTTATGAIDPLADIADVAAAEQLWLHVDGAYGAPAAATPVARDAFAALDRADSLAVDAHKWLSVPVTCGALLVRDPAASYGAFGPAGDYVRVLADEPEEAFAFWDYGLELSRPSRAMKLWLTFRHLGARRLALAVEEDIALAHELADLVRAADDLELLCEPSLSICCFRHRPPGIPEDELAAHNERVLVALQRDGRVYLSNVTVRGVVGLRACIVNFRTTPEILRTTIELVRTLGSQLIDVKANAPNG